jgi:NAD-dependent deacetylase
LSFDEAAAIVREGALPKCGLCGGVLKPAITFFGESLPPMALRRAAEMAAAADLLLVLGTSLTVYPAAGIPEYTLRSGGKVVIVNNQPTHLDSRAVLHFDDLGEVFEALNAMF